MHRHRTKLRLLLLGSGLLVAAGLAEALLQLVPGVLPADANGLPNLTTPTAAPGFWSATPTLNALADGGELGFYVADTHWNAIGRNAVADAPIAQLRTTDLLR
jgi:hypothetical protein